MTGKASASREPAPVVLWILPAVLTVGLLLFSQTIAWYGDEGYHLLAAQLINAGRTPYLDFFYPQAPLYPYLGAAWMRVFGENWRSAHALSAVLTGASIALVTGFIFSRLPEPRCRVSIAAAGALLYGLNTSVLRMGTIGHPFAACLLLSTASFRLAVAAAVRTTWVLPAAAGFCSGAAAGSSLLAAPVSVVLSVWTIRHSVAGDRAKRCAAFVGGAVVSFLPLLWLAARSPRQVFFSVVQYHLLHRVPDASKQDLVGHNVREVVAWISSPQVLLVAGLAVTGLVLGRSEWEACRRAEFRLCWWLAGGLAVYLLIPAPTYSQYFVLLAPFLSILGSGGVLAIASRVPTRARPAWVALAAIALFALPLAKSAYRRREYVPPYWHDIEQFAREINSTTPAGGRIYAREDIYFAARRLPPAGLENSYAAGVRLPPDRAASFHIVSQSQIDELLARGAFATVWMEGDDPRVESLKLPRLYAKQKRLTDLRIFGDCYLFWDPAPRSEERR